MSVSRKDMIANIQKNRIKRRRTLETLVLLSVLVFTGVMWKLRMQGITLTDDVQYRCGLEQHQHFDACYEKDLICGMEQIEFLENGQPGHVHTDECYELRMVCGKEEHSHTAECFYEEESDSGGTSIEPSEGEEEPEGLPSESDSDEEDEEWEEDFDEEFEFDENFDFSAWLGGVSLLAAPVDPPYEVGAIYISTQLGEKHKDQVHEYLDGVYWWNSTKGYLNTPVLNTDGTPVLDGNGDPLYKYIGNGHEGDNPDLGYVLHPGDRIEICAYIPDYPKNASLAFIRGEQNPGNGSWTELYHAQFISQENVSMGNGYRRVSAVIQAGSVGWEPVQLGYYSSPSISTEIGDVWSKFHINVKASDDNQYYTHADIEIDDDGFYNHIEDLTLKNGKTYRITTQYSTIISGVNYCKIYKSTDLNDDTQAVMYREVSPGVYEPWADQEYAYRPQDYKNIGASGSGQFEFTSEPNFAGTLHRVRYFKINEAGRAEFDVSVILKRKSVSVIDLATGLPATDFPLPDIGDLEVESAIYRINLNHKSVIDANNKCPYHSGLDFTVSKDLYSELQVDPVSLGFDLTKTLKGREYINDRKYQFVVESASTGKVVATGNTDGDGNILLPRLLFFAPKYGYYEYKVREVVPDGATTLPDGRKYYNGVVYTNKVYDLKVKVGWKSGTEELELQEVLVDGVNVLSGAATSETVGLTTGFVNEIPDEGGSSGVTLTDLSVKKKWSDEETVNHSGDSIQFRIFRSVNGVREEEPYSYNGNKIFTLSEANGWKMNLPSILASAGSETYTYEIEEYPVPAGYTASTKTFDGKDFTITNKANKAYLYLEKKWVGPGGDPISAPPITELPVTLRRKQKEVRVPVRIEVQDTDGKTIDNYPINEYIGSRVQVSLALDGADKRGTIVGLSATSSDGGTVVPTMLASDKAQIEFDVAEGQIITVKMDNRLADSDIIARYGVEETVGSGTWSDRGSHMTTGWWTYYTKHNGVDEPASYKAERRGNGWAGFFLIDDSLFITGKEYSFSVYARYVNEHTPESGSKTYPGRSNLSFSMGMDTVTGKDASNNDIHQYTYMTASAGTDAGNWIHMSMPSFTIPGGTNPRLYIQTDEPNGVDCVDFFIDEFIIAPDGVETDVKRNGTQFDYVRRINPKYKVNVDHRDISPELDYAAHNFVDDPEFVEHLTLTQAEGWRMKLDTATLNEAVNKEYRYYPEESIAISGYQVTYSDTLVPWNTPSSPMIIQNKAIPYELPATGGMGAARVHNAGGILVLLFSVLLALRYRKRVKRRSSA